MHHVAHYGTFLVDLYGIVYKVKLSNLKPNPKNPRVIKDDKFKRLVQSLKDFPQMMELRPIVVDADMVVLGGNMRLKAIQELGMKEIPDSWVKKASDLTEDQKRQFIIKDNVGFGEWDWDALANEWDENELKDWGLELPVNFKGEAEEDDYEIPDEIETDIITGDLFEIGQHRLLCGDSTNADDVAKVMDDCKPILMVTDPPYGVNYDADWRNRAERPNGKPYGGRAIGLVTNDDKVDWTLTYSLFTGDVCYVWHGGRHAAEVQGNLATAGFEIVCQVIWGKNGHVISRGDYHWQHEPCWYAVRKGAKHHWQGSRSETTLWAIDRPKKSETGHSTQKPIECMARPIRNNLRKRNRLRSVPWLRHDNGSRSPT